MANAWIHLNGRLVPEREAVVSVMDRGFLYGDGVFETVLVRQGLPFRLERHLERLRLGLDHLGIDPGIAAAAWTTAVEELIRANNVADAVLRLAVSRGAGARGYSTRGCGPPTVVMSLHELPESDPLTPRVWRLKAVSTRLAIGGDLSGHKTANKLVQILARREAEAAGCDEALLLDEKGRVLEGAAGNVFWVNAGRVTTTPLSAGVLPGLTRDWVMEQCGRLGWPVGEDWIGLEELCAADGAFLTLSTLGVVEIGEVDGRPLRRSPQVAGLHRDFQSATRLSGAKNP